MSCGNEVEMKRKYHIRVSAVECEGLPGATVDDLAAALGGRVRRLNSGTWLDVTVEDDPAVRECERTRNAGKKRVGLPAGSPLEGMDEATAERWASRHTAREVQEALGISRTAYYQRRRSGRLLPDDGEDERS